MQANVVGKTCKFDLRAVERGRMPNKKAWFLDPVEVEREQKMTSSPQTTFQCKQCKAEFKQYDHLSFHMKMHELMREQDKKANLKVFGGKLIEEE
jgi:hypothetical protein